MDLVLPALPISPGLGAAQARIMLTYLWRHGKLPKLDNPETFTEWVQWRKLNDRDARMPLLADKVRIKQIVADCLGEDWVIPTLWHGEVLPLRPEWPTPFVVKSRHGCNQYAFIFDEAADWSAIRRKSSRWMRREYGLWLDEWLYTKVPRGIIVEPFVGNGQTLPIDYKFYVFGGRVEYVQVHLDRGGRHRWALFDRDWQRISSDTTNPDPSPPHSLGRMITAAEALGRRFDFVRLDFYEQHGQPLFGEMTFYPGSGLDRFSPTSLDSALGSHWARADQRR